MKQLLWLGVLSLLTACSKDAAPPAQSPVQPDAELSAGPAAATPEPPPAESPPANEIDLLSLFGAQIQVATDLPVSELRGDFTGDGIEDRAYLVKSSSFPPNLAPDVQVIRPFQKSAEKAAVMKQALDVTQGSPVSLVLVIGGPNFPISTVVVHDPQVDGRLAAAAQGGMRLLEPADFAAAASQPAKGDAVALQGRGGDEIFYWDGARFLLVTAAGAAP